MSRLRIKGSLGDKSFGILVRKELASHDVALDRNQSGGKGEEELMLDTKDMEELSPKSPNFIVGAFLFCRWSFG